jgi:hypothetical protein
MYILIRCHKTLPVPLPAPMCWDQFWLDHSSNNSIDVGYMLMISAVNLGILRM